jgi:hypothetical protein
VTERLTVSETVMLAAEEAVEKQRSAMATIETRLRTLIGVSPGSA